MLGQEGIPTRILQVNRLASLASAIPLREYKVHMIRFDYFKKFLLHISRKKPNKYSLYACADEQFALLLLCICGALLPISPFSVYLALILIKKL
jgi:hypothetical protein